jgi:hypothetical protein
LARNEHGGLPQRGRLARRRRACRRALEELVRRPLAKPRTGSLRGRACRLRLGLLLRRLALDVGQRLDAELADNHSSTCFSNVGRQAPACRLAEENDRCNRQ